MLKLYIHIDLVIRTSAASHQIGLIGPPVSLLAAFTSHFTLDFLESSATNLPSVKSIGKWKTNKQTDFCEQQKIMVLAFILIWIFFFILIYY